MGIIFVLLVIGTTIWATIDAVGMQRYKYEGYGNAFVVFLGCALLWIVCFPVYLIRRSAIVNGTAKLKSIYENDPPSRMIANQKSVFPSKLNEGSSSSGNRYEQIQKLGELKDKGLLTEEEFTQEKSKIMQG